MLNSVTHFTLTPADEATRNWYTISNSSSYRRQSFVITCEHFCFTSGHCIRFIFDLTLLNCAYSNDWRLLFFRDRNYWYWTKFWMTIVWVLPIFSETTRRGFAWALIHLSLACLFFTLFASDYANKFIFY